MRFPHPSILASILLPAITGCGARDQPVSARAPAVRATATAPDATPDDAPHPRRADIDRMYAEYRVSFPDVTDITANELRRRLDAGERVVLVDCREAKEQAVSMIPDAITQEAFEANPASYADAVVVTYCTIGYRSGMYGKTLAESHQVMNLAGGVLEWAHTGGVFLAPDGRPTRSVHVYGRTWDLLPDDYTSVY